MTIISKGNKKLGSIHNVSLTPIKSCGNCSSCSKDCYAKKAYRMYPAVKNAWDSNLDLAKNDPELYFQGIIDHLNIKRGRPLNIFRWHVSGDILDQNYLDNIVKIAKTFKNIKFLCFTKMFNLDFEKASKIKNLCIVFSIFPDMELPKNLYRFPFAFMQDGTETRIKNSIECFGDCSACFMCWNLQKLKKNVYFDKH